MYNNLYASSITFGFVAIYKSEGFFFFPLLKQVFFFFLALRDSFAAAWAATLQSLLIQRKRHHENLDLKFQVLHIILATD